MAESKPSQNSLPMTMLFVVVVLGLSGASSVFFFMSADAAVSDGGPVWLPLLLRGLGVLIFTFGVGFAGLITLLGDYLDDAASARDQQSQPTDTTPQPKQG